MPATRSVALLVAVTVVAVAGLTLAPVASGALGSTIGDDADAESNDNETASVGAVMQANAADAESSVDAGMFDAKYDDADNETRGDLVVDRTDDLEERIAELEAERENLSERSDELHPGHYQAAMSQYAVQIQALEREIDRTEHRANETGVDVDRLAELRTSAADLAGHEVAEIARGIAGVGDSPGQGPPEGETPGQGPPHESGNESDGEPGQVPGDDQPGTDDDRTGQGPDT